MAKKKPENVQSRNFKLLLYPDNPQHMEVLHQVKQLYPDHIGILHNANPERKPHYHVALTVGAAPVQVGTLCRKLGFVTELLEPDLQFIRVLDGRMDRFLVYLTHMDDPAKEQYNASDLFGSNKMLADFGRAATRFMRNEFDMSDCVIACLDWIRSRYDQVISMTSFARWICNTPYFKASGSPLVRSCIEEHNQRIYNASRAAYIEDLADSAEKHAAILQYPETQKLPDELPATCIDDSEELIW